MYSQRVCGYWPSLARPVGASAIPLNPLQQQCGSSGVTCRNELAQRGQIETLHQFALLV